MKFFITGVSSGIGRVLAELLVDRGVQVWGVARRREKLEELAGKFENGFFYSVCDVSEDNQVDQTVVEMREQNFLPDVVVLNAGMYSSDLADSYDHEKAEEIFQTNLHGALTWVDKFLPQLSGRKVQFIAISSVAKFRPDIKSVSYPSSKTALSMAFRSLRLGVKDKDIIFKTIHFGPVATLVIPRYEKATKSPVVISADKAARFIIKTTDSKKSDFYYPPLISWIIRLTLWLPDKTFSNLMSKFRR